MCPDQQNRNLMVYGTTRNQLSHLARAMFCFYYDLGIFCFYSRSHQKETKTKKKSQLHHNFPNWILLFALSFPRNKWIFHPKAIHWGGVCGGVPVVFLLLLAFSGLTLQYKWSLWSNQKSLWGKETEGMRGGKGGAGNCLSPLCLAQMRKANPGDKPVQVMEDLWSLVSQLQSCPRPCSLSVEWASFPKEFFELGSLGRQEKE